MAKLKLKTEKIRNEMNRLGLSERALAELMEPKTSKQLVNYWLKTGSVAGIYRIAKALELDPKDIL